jgi:spore germination protein GerM
MKKYIALFLLIILIVALPVGCKKDESQPDPDPIQEQPKEQPPVLVEKEILLLYPDRDNNFLLPEFRKITAVEETELEEMVELVLEELIKGPSNEMLKSMIDRDTEVLSVKIHGTTATVDLSEVFIDKGHNGREKLFQVFSVVNTLSELGLVEVFLLVEGSPITDHYTALDHGMPFIRNDELIPSK